MKTNTYTILAYFIVLQLSCETWDVKIEKIKNTCKPSLKSSFHSDISHEFKFFVCHFCFAPSITQSDVNQMCCYQIFSFCFQLKLSFHDLTTMLVCNIFSQMSAVGIL